MADLVSDVLRWQSHPSFKCWIRYWYDMKNKIHVQWTPDFEFNSFPEPVRTPNLFEVRIRFPIGNEGNEINSFQNPRPSLKTHLQEIFVREYMYMRCLYSTYVNE